MKPLRARKFYLVEVDRLPDDETEMRLFEVEQDVYRVLEVIDGRADGRNLASTTFESGITVTKAGTIGGDPQAFGLDSGFKPTFKGITLTGGDTDIVDGCLAMAAGSKLLPARMTQEEADFYKARNGEVYFTTDRPGIEMNAGLV